MIAPRTVEPVALPMTAPFSALFMAQLAPSHIRANNVRRPVKERFKARVLSFQREAACRLEVSSDRPRPVSFEGCSDTVEPTTYRRRSRGRARARQIQAPYRSGVQRALESHECGQRRLRSAARGS